MADNICPHGHTTGTAKNDHIWNKFAVFKINISIMVAQVAAFLVSLGFHFIYPDSVIGEITEESRLQTHVRPLSELQR